MREENSRTLLHNHLAQFMDDRLQKIRETLKTVYPHQEKPMTHRSLSSLEYGALQKLYRFSLRLCDAYLWLYGSLQARQPSSKADGILFPSITIVVSVTDQIEQLAQTVESLLSSQYSGLCISIVWLGKVPERIGNIPERPDIRFSQASPGASKSEAIRSVLLRTTTPVFAWLEPGDTLTPDVLHQVSKSFRRTRVGGVFVPKKELFIPQSVSPPMSLGLSFLWEQNSSFPAKFFVRRECFWGATKTFCGTDYDCNDWAVALNSSRFSRVNMISGDFFASEIAQPGPKTKDDKIIRSKINTQMWWPERLRRFTMKRVRQISAHFPKMNLHGERRSEGSPSRVPANRPTERIKTPNWHALSERFSGFFHRRDDRILRNLPVVF